MADEKIRILADHATSQRIAGDLTRPRLPRRRGPRRGQHRLPGGLRRRRRQRQRGRRRNHTAGTGGAGTQPGGSVPTSIDTEANSFNLYTWAEYDDPDLMASFGNITLDIFRLERGGDREAAGRRAARAATTWSSRPARTSRRWPV